MIVRREVLNDGRAWLELPVVVVRDEPELLATYIAEGTPFHFPAGDWPTPSGRHPWHGRPAWQGHGVLMLQRPGEAHAIWVFWHGPAREFTGWYVNLQEPFRRTRAGLRHAGPRARHLGAGRAAAGNGRMRTCSRNASAKAGYTPEQVEETWAEGRRVVAELEAGRRWWDPWWALWEPDPAWAAWRRSEPRGARHRGVGDRFDPAARADTRRLLLARSLLGRLGGGAAERPAGDRRVEGRARHRDAVRLGRVDPRDVPARAARDRPLRRTARSRSAAPASRSRRCCPGSRVAAGLIVALAACGMGSGWSTSRSTRTSDASRTPPAGGCSRSRTAPTRSACSSVRRRGPRTERRRRPRDDPDRGLGRDRSHGAARLHRPRAVHAGRSHGLRLAHGLVAIGLVGAVAFVVEGGTESWSALFLERQLHAEPAVSGLGPGVFAAAMAPDASPVRRQGASPTACCSVAERHSPRSAAQRSRWRRLRHSRWSASRWPAAASR